MNSVPDQNRRPDVRYSIRLQAPAKLTLTLEVTGVRADGLHLIRAEMVTVDFYDTLDLAPEAEGLTVIGGGPDVSVGPDNLVNRALPCAAVGPLFASPNGSPPRPASAVARPTPGRSSDGPNSMISTRRPGSAPMSPSVQSVAGRSSRGSAKS